MVNISSIFAKSPFKALHNHMDKVVESVAPLENFFDFLFLEDFSKLEKIKDQIIEAEDAADSIHLELNHMKHSELGPTYLTLLEAVKQKGLQKAEVVLHS